VRQLLLHSLDWLSMVRCIYMLRDCNSSKYPVEIHGAIGAVVPSLVRLIFGNNSFKATSTIFHLAKHGTLQPEISETSLICEVGLHTAIGGAIPQLLQLFTYNPPEESHMMDQKISEKISSEAAALICTLTEHCESLGVWFIIC
jgi:hypothetical protein